MQNPFINTTSFKTLYSRH